jgi:prevent-host-death family protein
MKKTIRTVNIHEAKTQLSKLVDLASKGEPFIIAKAGKPLVKVIAVDAPTPKQVRRLGFMIGQIEVPEDFDVMGSSEISQAFEGKE